jgi:hypothetical protein
MGVATQRPVTPRKPIRRLTLLGGRGGWGEPLDEGECGAGDFAPAAVDGEGVSAAGHMGDLGHAFVAGLVLVGGVRDGRGDGVVLSPEMLLGLILADRVGEGVAELVEGAPYRSGLAGTVRALRRA